MNNKTEKIQQGRKSIVVFSSASFLNDFGSDIVYPAGKMRGWKLADRLGRKLVLTLAYPSGD